MKIQGIEIPYSEIKQILTGIKNGENWAINFHKVPNGDSVPSFLMPTKIYRHIIGGKTIVDAAELVGNYGQPMTFKK